MRHLEVGLVHLVVAHQQHVDVEGARTPALHPHAMLALLEPLTDFEQLTRRQRVSTATTAFR